MRERAVCIVLRNNKILFVQQMVSGQLKHVFIGGGVEDNETPQAAALRELEEEANVKGEIVFGSAIIETNMKEHIFIVSIPEDAQPALGHDPELPLDKQDIKSLIWRDTIEEIGHFNESDCEFFQAIIDEGRKNNINESWIDILEKIILHNTRKKALN